MRRLVVLTALLFALPANAVTIDWVTVGDPGNPVDTEVMNDGTTGYGSVGYTYKIGKYEVTNAQYVEFLNAVAVNDTYGLYDSQMAVGDGGIVRTGGSGSHTYSAIAGREDWPVHHVSWYDTLRFANWLHNGQPAGAQDSNSTEDGTYTFSGSMSVGSRNAGATIFLPTEDEWYKAAYFDSALGVYYDYPTGTDTQTVCTSPSGDTGSSANCHGAVGSPTDVGAYGMSGSPYGTFDQGGNLAEWTETLHGDPAGVYRVKRGGSWHDNIYGAPENLSAAVRYGVRVDFEGGLRVAMIPEPATVSLLCVGLAALALRRQFTA